MKKIFIVLMMVLLATMLIVSCDDNAKKVYKVTFVTNGGSVVNPVEVEEGEKVARPSPDPTKDDNLFVRWTTDAAGKTKYDFESAVNADITLYAQWIEETINLGQKGDEQITWLVLDVNAEDNTVLLISQDILEKKQFHNSATTTTDRDYATSGIYDYLNNSFISTYKLTSIDMKETDLSDVSVTGAKVFLLSKAEAEEYFKTEAARVANFEDTATAWWLRTPSSNGISAYYVKTDGYTNPAGVLTDALGVRPAFWCKLN